MGAGGSAATGEGVRGVAVGREWGWSREMGGGVSGSVLMGAVVCGWGCSSRWGGEGGGVDGGSVVGCGGVGGWQRGVRPTWVGVHAQGERA